MTALDAALAGPAGPYVAIIGMALGAYACRIGGIALMSRVTVTARVERGLRALPGSIMMATVAPVALQSGVAGVLGLAAALGVTAVTRIEIAGVAAGLVTVAAARAMGG
jgi:uncharacterized membrane protein